MVRSSSFRLINMTEEKKRYKLKIRSKFLPSTPKICHFSETPLNTYKYIPLEYVNCDFKLRVK